MQDSQSLPHLDVLEMDVFTLEIIQNRGETVPRDLNAVRDWIFWEVNLARAEGYPWPLC